MRLRTVEKLLPMKRLSAISSRLKRFINVAVMFLHVILWIIKMRRLPIALERLDFQKVLL